MKRRLHSKLVQRPLDQRTAAEGFSFPGVDPRQWCSFGVVARGADDEVLEFNEDDGQPYVRVILKPSEHLVNCRVSSQVAGAGEAEWSPFVEGDEVICVLPEGREDSGVVIIGRLNNSLDKFPTESVAGQDPTTNSFAFRRRRTPFVEEHAGPVLLRSALTGAFISIDNLGAVTIKDSENSALQMSADMFGYQGPSNTSKAPEYLLQIDLTNERFTLQVKDAMLTIGGSGASANPGQSMFVLPGDLIVNTGNEPAEHVATVEFVLGMIAALCSSLAAPAAGPAALAALNLLIAGGGVSAAPFAASLTAGLAIAGSVPKSPAPTGVQLGQTLGAVRFRVG